MRETLNNARLLSLIAPLFSHLCEKEYAEVRENLAWPAARNAVACLAENADERRLFERACRLPAWPERSLLQNEVLVSGMPLAALPVESLYKPWSLEPGNAYGAQRGLFLGDPARHLQAVYAALDLTVPDQFVATPDHLALELDLLGLLVESGNVAAARDVAADHLDWLPAYDDALSRAAEQAAGTTRLDESHRAGLAEGIAHLRALTALAGRLVREATFAPAAHAQPTEPLATCGDVQ
ncbi:MULTISPECIES: molecular chaperone TorD family protein [Gordonibacter]|uniref:Molecular chaperone TorD family protein n=1 Tax=Gordonibacter faecis TaxID=3047475 RepID=A0ABT7DL43_9ACTN|nr:MULTISPECIES: molecular chaperone TorD family protein [unclassified Gordonibacter]MDJ1650256.1 molecular chaperone TorD family protein [Gordonibacter sp. KGMB12511]